MELHLKYADEGEKIVVPLSTLVVYVPWYRLETRELIDQQPLFDKYRKFAEHARENGMLALFVDEDQEVELVDHCQKNGFFYVTALHINLKDSVYHISGWLDRLSVYHISGWLDDLDSRISLTWSLGSECATITL